jgi:dolichol-phosphate mannosyltransferase
MPPPDPVLAIVIPVYNEEKHIMALLQDWLPVFRDTGKTYRVILIDDGSKDNSLQLLRTLQAGNLSIDVHTQANAGHGPAILKGYKLALGAEWVFQLDSDHQLETAAFAELWAKREQFDLLVAQRIERNASSSRQYISWLARFLVRLLAGAGIEDVNSPYRLIRAKCLQKALEKIPVNSFAPNVMISSWFIRKKNRIFTTTVQQRKEDLRPSRMNAYFLRGVLRSTLQTILFRIK